MNSAACAEIERCGASQSATHRANSERDRAVSQLRPGSSRNRPAGSGHAVHRGRRKDRGITANGTHRKHRQVRTVSTHWGGTIRWFVLLPNVA